MFVVSIAYGIPSFYALEGFPEENRCETYDEFGQLYLLVGTVVLEVGLPLAVVVFANIGIVYSIRTRKPATSNNAAAAKHQKEDDAVTKILLIVSLVYILLRIIFVGAIIQILAWIENIAIYGLPARYLVDFYYYIVVLVLTLNSAVNFYLYCITGKFFRQCFLNMLKGKKN